MNPDKWIGFSTVGIGLLWAYFLIVFFLGNTILGVSVRTRYLASIAAVSFAGIYWLLRWTYRRQFISETRLKKLTVTSLITLLSFIAADACYSVYTNAAKPLDYHHFFQASYRLADPQLWISEVLPKEYSPARKTFALYKPNATSSGDVYGWLYYPLMMKSPTLVKSVLERRHVRYSIDENGFRNVTPMDQARIFALGDSPTFGMSSNQTETWVTLLEQKRGEPIYNFGTFVSVEKQVMLLEYMLQTKPSSLKIRELLWMIFEGNTLEHIDGKPLDQIGTNDALESIIKGTLLDWLASLPRLVKEQSIINRLLTGRITTGLRQRATNGADPYVIDGMRFAHPLYYSPQHGHRLFYAAYIERAGKPESYVLKHPSLRILNQAFGDMASLSKVHGFKVTVIIAPSAARLYAPYFENFPPISGHAHFINYLEHLSRRLGFGVVNLYNLMQPYARKELLYWRDDTHWNERGNEVAAELVARHAKF
ncbi:MAG: hypothetical protein MN733_11020 [Nitrososphaera sp.]|nr:hypothetical protein [Nitrososphaera sp.]